MSSPPKGGSNSSTSLQEIPKGSKKKGASSKKAAASSTAEADGHPGPSTSVIPPQPKKVSKNNKENREEISAASSNSTPVAHNNNNQQDDKKHKSCCVCICCCFSCSWLREFIRTRILRPRLTVQNQVNEKNNKMHAFSSTENFFNGSESEAPPTIEEIRSWGESFDRLMRCAAGRQLFRDFLRHEYSEENILFWLACEDLKKERNPELIEEKARSIYEDYVSILSPKEVSLDSRVREIVNRNMKQPTANTFDEAQLQIYTLMHRDSYPRFVGSPMYRRMAQLSPPSPPTRRISISVG